MTETPLVITRRDLVANDTVLAFLLGLKNKKQLESLDWNLYRDRALVIRAVESIVGSDYNLWMGAGMKEGTIALRTNKNPEIAILCAWNIWYGECMGS